ncbi:MAG: 50S ribosomal protein L2 [Candidatus Shikimatogenerans sp. AspAUS03]|uniref:Large ribosomal subunit protein uL2 n=1 Tax=Candidatus Shikimatogenerans sp. AspAUS03 TaxID=3158563 RepID=A0AAU7QTZ7_9FLAO
MNLKKYNPITSSQRFKVLIDYKNILKKDKFYKIKKLLLKKKKKKNGRNNQGKITVSHLGGGHKRKYRIIDYKRNKFDIYGYVKSIEYDPNRNCFISLIYYLDGEKRYILTNKNFELNQKILSSKKKISIKLGYSMPLKYIPDGTFVSCIEKRPFTGGIYSRSAGNYSKLLSKENNYVNIKLSSNKVIKLLSNCMATIGIISNEDNKLITLGKAGRNRWLGKRPRTRGVAMNPVDHPMGGGEGKASGGHPRNKKGLLSKGYKTKRK